MMKVRSVKEFAFTTTVQVLFHCFKRSVSMRFGTSGVVRARARVLVGEQPRADLRS